MIARTIALAIAIASLQIALTCACSGRSDPTAAWLTLYHFDSDYFRTVVVSGYDYPAEPTPGHVGNIAFFPGYPLLARGVASYTDTPADVALLVAAQLSCFGFWIYFLLLLREWNVPTIAKTACFALVVSHPTAFILVCGYSESTFLMALVGFVYWSHRPGPTAAILAALHGAPMTATRLVGIPVAAYPILLAWANRAGVGGYAKAWAIASVAALGAAGYALFLQIEFGDWRVYSQSQAIGWNVHPDPFAFFRRGTWALNYAEVVNVWTDLAALERLFVPLTCLQFAAFGLGEWLARRGGRSSNLRRRVPLYFAALALFAVPVMAHAGRGMSSIARFALCWDVVLALILAGLLADRPEWAAKKWIRVLLFGEAILAMTIQPMLAHKFTHGVFVG